MPVATPRKGTLIVRLLDRPVGRLDAIASQVLHQSERLAQELAAEWPNDIYGKIISVISLQLKQVAV